MATLRGTQPGATPGAERPGRSLRERGHPLTRGLHWFRNDLRLRDNTALYALAAEVEAWLAVFVFDPRLAAQEGTPRARFLGDCLARLSRDLARRGVPLLIRSGRPERVLPKLLHETGARLVSWNDGGTAFARRRDAAVRNAVEKHGARSLTRRDHVVFGAESIRNGSGGPYAVFTPYKRKWWQRFAQEPQVSSPFPRLPPAIPGFAADALPGVQVGPRDGAPARLPTGGEAAAQRRLASFLSGTAARYHEDRDRPDLDGTSRLSPYLRFGAISPRQCFESGIQAAADEPKLRAGVRKWLDELVWREFYAAILEEHPRVRSESYRRDTLAVRWNDDAPGFEAWCEGRTGYPVVDAGMRQLRETGWMHNRVRMIVASFLTKDLLIDWRAGERYFFERLVDGDPASNNGGWQWAASTGTDAQPFFRIFNPVTQGRRFDPDGDYVRRWVPELRGLSGARVHEPWKAAAHAPDYPPQLLDHAVRREQAIGRFRAARAVAAQK